jgi:hypothetical protein
MDMGFREDSTSIALCSDIDLYRLVGLWMLSFDNLCEKKMMDPRRRSFPKRGSWLWVNLHYRPL